MSHLRPDSTHEVVISNTSVVIQVNDQTSNRRLFPAVFHRRATRRWASGLLQIYCNTYNPVLLVYTIDKNTTEYGWRPCLVLCGIARRRTRGCSTKHCVPLLVTLTLQRQRDLEWKCFYTNISRDAIWNHNFCYRREGTNQPTNNTILRKITDKNHRHYTIKSLAFEYT